MCSQNSTTGMCSSRRQDSSHPHRSPTALCRCNGSARAPSVILLSAHGGFPSCFSPTSVALHPSPRSSCSSRCQLQLGTCDISASSAASQKFDQNAEQIQLLLKIHHMNFRCKCVRASCNKRTGISNRVHVSLNCGESGNCACASQ